MEGSTLIALRHGTPLSDGYADETQRPLSSEGEAQVLKVLEILKMEGIKLDLLLSSPIPRALQTAFICGNMFGLDVEEERGLGYDFQGSVILNRLQPGKTVLAVGHAPNLAYFIQTLLGAEIPGGSFGTGEGAVIRFPGAPGTGKAELLTCLRQS